MESQPVIIIGAPRSGTNMLRDVLTSLPGFTTWRCDEVNFLWKHRNASRGHDVMTPEDASPAVATHIRRQFERLARAANAEYVVEKTCANSLRIPFVFGVLPAAKFVFIHRDGVDAIASTVKRWRNPRPGLRYYLQKFRYVPAQDRPRVLFEALRRRSWRLIGRGERGWPSWGPLFPELLEALEEDADLINICALQWSRCVQAALEDLSHLPTDRWHPVSYEDFVKHPEERLRRLTSFLGVESSPATIVQAAAKVETGSVNRGSRELRPEELDRIKPAVEAVRHRLQDLRVRENHG